MKRTILTAVMAAAMLAAPAAVQSQETGTRDVRAELRAMVTDAPAASDSRARIEAFLQGDDVAAVAERNAMDVERLADAVATLDDRTAANLAERVNDADKQLAGGDTITITTTTLIIALLVLIIILVA